MTRIFIPSDGIASWRARLADPEKHWKREASAFEAAVSWANAARTDRGLPLAVCQLFDRIVEFRGASLLFAFPEHKVPLPGGVRASQTDVWTVLRGPLGLVSMAVEAKAEESFGDTLEAWQQVPTPGKARRLSYLREILKCAAEFPSSIRYQLLHRTASAIIEAQRIGAPFAIMMVHSFRENSASEGDYAAFGNCFGATLSSNALVGVEGHTNPKLYLGWATSPLCSDKDIANVCS
jgi:hypothetical protein